MDTLDRSPDLSAAQFREPVRQQYKARQRDDRSTDSEKQQPPAVDPVALGPVHDVQAPDEVEEAPGIASSGENRAARRIDVEPRRVWIGEGDLPRRSGNPRGPNAGYPAEAATKF